MSSERHRRTASPAVPSPVRAAHTALAWVVVFFGFHVYWYLGGSFADPGSLPGAPHSVGGWILLVLVAWAFPVAAWVCLAIAHASPSGRAGHVVAVVVWVGCVLLAVRGGLGLVDELTRAAGSAHGITGLSVQEATGATHVGWASRAIDAYFVLGGAVFGRLGIRYRHSRSQDRPPRPVTGVDPLRHLAD